MGNALITDLYEFNKAAPTASTAVPHRRDDVGTVGPFMRLGGSAPP